MRSVGLAVAALFICWAMPVLLEARPGGGQGYSGGSSGRSSGSSGSSSSSGTYDSSAQSSSSHESTSSGSGGGTSTPDKNQPFWNFVGFLLILYVAYTFTVQAKEARQREAAGDPGSWDSRADRPPPSPPPRPRDEGPQWRTPKDAFVLIRAADPEFSAVLFDDFVYGLYAAAHRARHDGGALALLAPYLAPAVREDLAARTPVGARVESVVVGAMRLLGSRLSRPNPANGKHEVKIEIESNVTTAAAGPDAPARACYVKEAWILSRGAQAHTRPWKGARTFGCPACGAPATEIGATGCRACGQAIDNGRFDWQVASVEVLDSEPRPPALTGAVEERGTDLPTAKSPSLDADWDALAAADPAVTHTVLAERVTGIFAALHAGWAAQDLRPVRPFASDALLQYLQYWVDAYRAQGLRNAVERARIVKLETAKVVRDLHYDAVTVRVFATGFEVTTDAAGDLVGGDRGRERPYSEYWTVIRGAAVRGVRAKPGACPACGADLSINMAGSCEFCGAHVTAGEFDWVLSRIEQDDSYSG
jgi:Tim44-like domain